MKDKIPIKNGFPQGGQPKDLSSENIEKENLKVNKPSDDDFRIEELEKELKKKESDIEFLKEKLSNNKEILQNVMEDKELLTKQVQDFEIKEIDAKLNNFQKLQQEHHKMEHRLSVTKKLLDEANEKIEVHKKIIEDMENRGLIDYLLKRFPESFKEYKENK